MSDAAIQQVIASLVPEGARVLDLGCGDGALMQRLMRERGCTGYGIEIDDAKVLCCVQRGVNVLQLNLHEGLADFGDQSFDAVLQIDTLQHLRNAETMLCETARVGRVGIIAQLTDELSLNYNYMEGDITRGGTQYRKTGNRLVPTGTRYNYRYDDFRHTASLVYQGKDNGIRAVLGYNYRKVDGYNNLTHMPQDSNATMDGQILDVQKNWKFGKDSMVLGYSYKREAIDLPEKRRSAVRTGNSLYASYSKQFTPKFNVTLGLRGEFINDPEEDQRVVVPQFQTEYKFDRNTAWYTNIGKAFQMPTVDDSFSYTRYNPAGLKPEEGWTYETGLKMRRGNDTWKAAFYHMNMKNKIGWARDSATQENYPVNKGNFKNTGVEVEYTKRFNNVWRLTLGGSISNPEVQDPSTRAKKWVQDAGRLEGLVRLDYQMAKWQGNLNLKYLGDREYIAQRFGAAQDVPDKIQLNMNVIYTAGKDDVVSLGIYNLLNRENYSNRYGNLDLGRNFRLTYTHAF